MSEEGRSEIGEKLLNYHHYNGIGHAMAHGWQVVEVRCTSIL